MPPRFEVTAYGNVFAADIVLPLLVGDPKLGEEVERGLEWILCNDKQKVIERGSAFNGFVIRDFDPPAYITYQSFKEVEDKIINASEQQTKLMVDFRAEADRKINQDPSTA